MERNLAILIIDHGSRRSEANESLKEIAQLVRARVPGEIFVMHAHMELASPTIAEGYRACVENGANHIFVHPYMLAPGRHATGDIPRLVQEVARDFPQVSFVVTEPLGVHQLLAEIILTRCGLR